MLGFLKKIFGRSAFRPPHEAHPVLGPASQQARAGDVRALMQIFTTAAQDPSLRYAAVQACVLSYLSGSDNAAPAYEGWVKHSPDDVFGRLARAAFLLERIPGYNPDDDDADAKRVEGDRLRNLASTDLSEARRLAPEDPVVGACVLDGQRPDQVDPDLYAWVAARAPGLVPAHRKRFWSLTERWGGEPGQTLAFSRELAAGSPATELPLFVMYAHWERHWYLEGMCDDKPGAQALLRDPEVRRECVAVYQATLALPQHQPTVETWWFRQLASRWFFLCAQTGSDDQDRARARTELQRLGDVFVPHDSYFWWLTEDEYSALRTELGVTGPT